MFMFKTLLISLTVNILKKLTLESKKEFVDKLEENMMFKAVYQNVLDITKQEYSLLKY